MDDERHLRDLIREGKVRIYLDDILIFSKMLDEHRRIVKRILQRLRKHKLFSKQKNANSKSLRRNTSG